MIDNKLNLELEVDRRKVILALEDLAADVGSVYDPSNFGGVAYDEIQECIERIMRCWKHCEVEQMLEAEEYRKDVEAGAPL